jgi:hypothetical protein
LNKESLPLIIGLLLPIFLVLIILLYNYGFDLTEIFKQIDIIYYIIIIPFLLGFLVIIVKYARPV